MVKGPIYGRRAFKEVIQKDSQLDSHGVMPLDAIVQPLPGGGIIKMSASLDSIEDEKVLDPISSRNNNSLFKL